MSDTAQHTQDQTVTSPAPDWELEQRFVPKALSELGVQGVSLVLSLSYAQTAFAKVGMDAWLTKLPVLKSLTPFKSDERLQDLDISCVVLDKQSHVLETVWYGNLRNANQSVRHTGDSLQGATTFEENFISQEEIHIRLKELPQAAHHLLFFVSSFYKHPLSLAKKGMVRLSDNEYQNIYKLSLDTLDKHTHALLFCHLQKIDGEFLLDVPLKSIQIKDTNPQDFIKTLTDISSEHICNPRNL